jgi:hypothetical protein
LARNNEGYLSGYFQRYFFRHFASKDDGFLSSSLLSNKQRSIPSSLPSNSPLSSAGSFPEYSTDNLETNVQSFLEKYKESCDVRRGSLK